MVFCSISNCGNSSKTCNFTNKGITFLTYSEYAGPIHDHDHHVYYAYESSGPSHGHVATSKHYGGGGHKSGASMSALTLLAFLFFLHILQQCIKDHMMEMSSSQPVMVMTASREGDEIIPKKLSNKVDKTGFTQLDEESSAENEEINTNKHNKKITDVKNPYNYDNSMNKKQLLKVHTAAHATKADDQKYKYVFNNHANRSSHFAGFVSAMDED